MANRSLRTASIACLGVWVVIWILFLVMSIGPFDVRRLPAAGTIMLVTLAVALLAPVAATGIAAFALIRAPRLKANLLTFAMASAALLGQVFLFLVSSYL